MCASGTIENGLSRREFLTGALAAAGAGIAPKIEASPCIARDDRPVTPAPARQRAVIPHDHPSEWQWRQVREDRECPTDHRSPLLGRRPGREGGRREYDCILLRAGPVESCLRELTMTDWVIPAEVLKACSVRRFNARAVYLDTGDAIGGWRPEDLVGVTFGACWDETRQAITGGIRLYDWDPASPAARVSAVLDELLAAYPAGVPGSVFAVSVAFWHTWHYLEDGLGTATTCLNAVQDLILHFDLEFGVEGAQREKLQALMAGS